MAWICGCSPTESFAKPQGGAAHRGRRLLFSPSLPLCRPVPPLGSVDGIPTPPPSRNRRVEAAWQNQPTTQRSGRGLEKRRGEMSELCCLR